MRERLGGEGSKKAKRDEIEKCLRVHTLTVPTFLLIPNAAVPFGSASKQQCALWVHSKIFSKGGMVTRLIDNGILIWH